MGACTGERTGGLGGGPARGIVLGAWVGASAGDCTGGLGGGLRGGTYLMRNKGFDKRNGRPYGGAPVMQCFIGVELD